MMKKRPKKINKGVQMIAYPNSFGGNLEGLDIVLGKYFSSVIEGVHILPFYPSSGDRGFAPLTHRKIDEKFGKDNDFKKISSKYLVMADLIVNHVSRESKYFEDYLKNGDNSKYRKFFIKARYFSRRFYNIPKNKFWRQIYFLIGRLAIFLRGIDFIFHKDGVNRLILKKIYRPRPGSPFVKFKRDDGKIRYIWCTFSPEQIDLNIDSSGVRRKFIRDIKYLSELGVKYLRLDAFAYTGKMRGTNNFLIPKSIRFLKWLADKAHEQGLIVIPEVHHNYKTQIFLSTLPGVDYVYDFALPFLVLHALYSKKSEYLKKWFEIRPDNCISNLDTHDGIGVVDVDGLLPEEEIEKVSRIIYERGGNAAKRASGNNSKNVDIYQINSTYYSALGEDDEAYFAARAIQLFLPGIPQIYYIGFLAGKNDIDLLEKTGIGRDINRHNYEIGEVAKEVERDIVKRVFELCRLRNNHPAFSGKFKIINIDKGKLHLKWQNNKKSLELIINLRDKKTIILDDGKGLEI